MQIDPPIPIRGASAGRTETGHIRRRNEDAILARDDLGLWAVADGLGGHASGDYASGLVVERLSALVRRGGVLDFVEAIEDCLGRVNRDLRAAAERQGVSLIGSTVVMLVEGPAYMLCGWVGDSRCYGFEDGRLRRMTRDHVVGASHDETGPEAGSAALTRAIGADAELFVDWVIAPNKPGARFLLCSDGLDKELSESEIEQKMIEGGEPGQIVDSLIDLALKRAARDNVSAIVVGLGS